VIDEIPCALLPPKKKNNRWVAEADLTSTYHR
jgi:hypothetical protein